MVKKHFLFLIVFLFWGTKLFAYDANLEQAVQLYYNADFNQAISVLLRDILLKKREDFELFEVKLTHQNIKPVLGKQVTVITPEFFLPR